jgi:hypothetical protein
VELEELEDPPLLLEFLWFTQEEEEAGEIQPWLAALLAEQGAEVEVDMVAPEELGLE